MFEKVNILRSIVVVVVVTCSSEGYNNFSFKAQIMRYFFTVLPEDAHISCHRNVTSILILNTEPWAKLKEWMIPEVLKFL
jgi:hypothetical protein